MCEIIPFIGTEKSGSKARGRLPQDKVRDSQTRIIDEVTVW